MGLSLMGRSSSYCETKRITPPPNPNPTNWRINRHIVTDFGMVVDITYPDCTTYEGRKIIVYKGTNLSLDMLTKKKIIDPHFTSVTGILKPFARLEPTQDGWLTAIKLIGAF